MPRIVVNIPGSRRRIEINLNENENVDSFKSLVSKSTSIPLEKLKIIIKGTPLQDEDDSILPSFSEGDSIIAMSVPKKPTPILKERKKSEVEEGEGEEEDELTFKLPENASIIQKKIAFFLKNVLKLPDLFLVIFFFLKLRTWLIIFLWFIFAPIVQMWDLGPIYILITFFAIIFLNLGQRKDGEASAYSIFNEGFRELPGTLNADRLDNDIRTGRY